MTSFGNMTRASSTARLYVFPCLNADSARLPSPTFSNRSPAYKRKKTVNKFLCRSRSRYIGQINRMDRAVSDKKIIYANITFLLQTLPLFADVLFHWIVKEFRDMILNVKKLKNSNLQGKRAAFRTHWFHNSISRLEGIEFWWRSACKTLAESNKKLFGFKIMFKTMKNVISWSTRRPFQAF